jgi:methylmalonyl-CoA/ethylmalonyl-CoA epimerase
MIGHIAVAVESLEKAGPLFSAILGTAMHGQEIVPEQGVRVGFFQVGESHIELLEPLNSSTPVGKYLEKHGPGMHHVSLEVQGLDRMLEELRARGIKLINDEPRLGAGNRRIAFIHPSSAGGVLFELAEQSASEET